MHVDKVVLTPHIRASDYILYWPEESASKQSSLCGMQEKLSFNANIIYGIGNNKEMKKSLVYSNKSINMTTFPCPNRNKSGSQDEDRGRKETRGRLLIFRDGKASFSLVVGEERNVYGNMLSSISLFRQPTITTNGLGCGYYCQLPHFLFTECCFGWPSSDSFRRIRQLSTLSSTLVSVSIDHCAAIDRDSCLAGH